MKKTTIVTRKPCTFSIGGIDMKKATLVALATVVMTLAMCFTLFTNVARAEETDTQSKYPVYTYTKDGDTITTWVYEGEDTEINGDYYTEGMIYIKGSKGVYYMACSNPLCYGFDQYGTIWIIRGDENAIYGWNYYLQNNDNVHRIKTNFIYRNQTLVFDAASLVFDENNEYVVGYKTLSGDVYPVLSYEEIEERVAEDADEDPDPTPTPTVVPTPTPNQPGTPSTPAVVNPTTNPGTVQPSDNKQPDVQSDKITLKKKGNTTSLYKGNTVVSKFTLKKGVLKYNGRTYKNVKSAGFIKKSGNLIFMDKKGKVFTVNAKGKKKTILKKNAKKLVFKSGYVTKVQKKSGSLNVAGK